MILPADTEKIAGVDVPKSDAFQFFLNLCRDFGRVFHLGIGGDDDIAFLRALDGAGAAVFVDGQVNGSHWKLL
ncbi:MAG TPA: hypothetical protein PLF42_12190 [Anaerolineales bacterium]|nr:hypothetical protein [Anaerolineales bacterium]